MEEIRVYIESGILELYAAGDLTDSERLEVEAMLSKHPELKIELSEIEKSFEQYAKSYSIEPSPSLREKVLGNLLNDNSRIKGLPEADNGNTSIRQISFYKYAFAASIALLVLSFVALIVLYSDLQESRSQLIALEESNQQYSNRVNYMNEQLSGKELALGVLRNPEYRLIKLAGTKQAPDASMMVAFHPENKEVMIDMAAMKMPANDTEHQYQLWAMVNGKPVDLGVFDMQPDNDSMKKMKAIDSPQAFAVTLEPRGGSKSPSMAQLMVMGSI